MPKKQNQKRKAIINYIPAGEKQQAFHDAWKTPVRILCGAWGSGKSYAAAAEIVSHLLENPLYIGKTALVVALTSHHAENQLLEQIFRPILSGATDRKGNAVGLIEDLDYTVTKKPQLKIEFFNGSKILFASLQADNNLAGYSVSMAYADELDKVSDEKIWSLIQSRVRGESDYGFSIATCNSDQGQSHWLYQRYFGPQENDGIVPTGCYLETLKARDNKFLSEQTMLTLKNMCFGDGRLEAQYLEGQWVSLAGMVFSEFDMKRHVYEPRTKDNRSGVIEMGLDWPRYVGMDFGFGDETAAYWIAKRPEDGAYFIYREYYQGGNTPRQNYENIKRSMFGNEYITKWVSDVAPEVRLTYREFGLPLQAASKGKGSVMQGVLMMKQLFFENKLFVSNRCENLIRELLRYAWDPRTNEPKKNQSDHGIDSCVTPGVHIQTDTGARPICDIRPGDYVLTRQGYRRVLESGLTKRNAPIYDVAFSNGTHLQATANHPVWIEGKGFVRVDALQYGDSSYHVDRKELSCIQKSNSTVNSIACIPASGTSANTPPNYIGQYGSISTGQFPKDITFITRMATRQITISPTWNAYHQKRISKNTVRKSANATVHQRTYNTLSVSGRLQKHGMPQKRVANGTLSMVKPLGKIASNETVNANTAMQHTRAEVIATTDSVQTTVARPGGGHLGLTTLLEPVPSVAMTSYPADTLGLKRVPAYVVRVSDAGTSDVYNLSVDQVPEYFANGVLVHNCRYILTDVEGKGNFFVAAPTDLTRYDLDIGDETKSVFSTGRPEVPSAVPEGCTLFGWEQDGTPIYARL